MPINKTRRDFLWQTGGGFAGVALTHLLTQDSFWKVEAASRAPHFPAKAKRAVFLFMNGAPSQVDTFDPKPELTKRNGQAYNGELAVGSNGRPVGYLMQSPFAFAPRGKSGLEISDLFPHTARFADDLCVIRSMYTDTAAHASGCLQMNTGSIFLGKPSMGAWVTYGLGAENESLPAFVVMTDPRGGPIGSASNWTAGYMPAAYQGTLFRASGAPLLDLRPPVDDRTQRRSLGLLKELNEQHRAKYPDDTELSARIQSYELAYRMQTEAASTVDLTKESAETRRRYGLDEAITADFGKKCLITRRLLEKGVRFVQLYSGGGHIEDTWDGHNDCITNHRLHAKETDQPIAALMEDLKATGLWDETLLIWGGEFGRTPTSEGVGKPGRDHDWHGFSMWLAGAGVKGGQAIGATDELGFAAVEDRVHVSDLHATVLHLLGFDHTRLSWFYSGMNQRLTGVRGEVVRKVLA